jgi:hypothetical protein
MSNPVADPDYAARALAYQKTTGSPYWTDPGCPPGRVNGMTPDGYDAAGH